MGFTKAAIASSLLLLGQAAALDSIVMKVRRFDASADDPHAPDDPLVLAASANLDSPL
jgi:hypothetical protein